MKSEVDSRWKPAIATVSLGAAHLHPIIAKLDALELATTSDLYHTLYSVHDNLTSPYDFCFRADPVFLLALRCTI
jgi:hypothetical protein